MVGIPDRGEYPEGGYARRRGVEYVQIGRVGTQPTLDMGPPRGYPPGY